MDKIGSFSLPKGGAPGFPGVAFIPEKRPQSPSEKKRSRTMPKRPEILPLLDLPFGLGMEQEAAFYNTLERQRS